MSNLNHDPVEDTEQYKRVIKAIDAQLDEEFPSAYPGSCHMIWQRKKELLAMEGIVWSDPAEMNPGTRFD